MHVFIAAWITSTRDTYVHKDFESTPVVYTLWKGPNSFTPAYDLKLVHTILLIISLGSAGAPSAGATVTSSAGGASMADRANWDTSRKGERDRE